MGYGLGGEVAWLKIKKTLIFIINVFLFLSILEI